MNVIYGQAAPDAKIVNWYNGKNPGMNTEKAYAALKNNKSTTVIVAVIDSGIDIEHKDLQGKIWVNEDEIPNNGIDDDKNGYIDDVHGWSFLGSSNGTNQQYARLEKTRLLASLSNRFYGKESGQIAAADRADYDLFVKLQKEIKQELEESTANLNYYKQLKDMLPGAKKEIEAKIGANFTVEDVKKWTPASDKEAKLKRIANGIATGQLTIEALNEGNVELVKQALEENPDLVNSTLISGKTRHSPLEIAVRNRNVELVKLLISYPNVDVNFSDFTVSCFSLLESAIILYESLMTYVFF
jgi:subtilisin family serine protease